VNKRALFPIIVINFILTVFIICSINFFDNVSYLSLAPLIILLFREILWIKKINPDKLKILLNDRHLAFIENHSIWMCIFEAHINENINLDKLQHLTFLKTFSIEFNKNESKVYIRIFTISLEEINLVMNRSYPILEAIFSDIQLLESNALVEKINENGIITINKKSFFCSKTHFILPLIPEEEIESKKYSSMIWTCKKDNNSNTLYGNIFYIKQFDKKIPFLFLKEYFLAYGTPSYKKSIDKNFVRMRLKSPLKDYSELPIEKTVEKIFLYLQEENINSFINKKKIKLRIQCQKTNESTDILSSNDNLIRLKKSRLSNKHSFQIQNLPNRNQICFELCNISNDPSLTEDEKRVKCDRKSKFCLKLLKNENFKLIIKNIIDQKHPAEHEYLLGELTQHISSQQLVCVLAHLSREPNQNLLHDDLLPILYRFIKHSIEAQLKLGKDENINLIPLKRTLDRKRIVGNV